MLAPSAAPSICPAPPRIRDSLIVNLSPYHYCIFFKSNRMRRNVIIPENLHRIRTLARVSS